MAALPRWMYGDPAQIVDRLKSMKIDARSAKSKQDQAREGREALFTGSRHDSKAQIKHRNSAE